MARQIVDIYNYALDLVGERSLTDPGQEGKVGVLCRNNYPGAVDEVLRSHDFNCATARKAIAPEAVAPEFGYTKKFALPTNPYCLKIRELIDHTAAYSVEGRFILSNESSIKLIYTKRITDPNEFDSMVVEAIATKLAAKIAYSLTQEVTKTADLQSLARKAIDAAASVDAQEAPEQVLQFGDWENY